MVFKTPSTGKVRTEADEQGQINHWKPRLVREIQDNFKPGDATSPLYQDHELFRAVMKVLDCHLGPEFIKELSTSPSMNITIAIWLGSLEGSKDRMRLQEKPPLRLRHDDDCT